LDDNAWLVLHLEIQHHLDIGAIEIRKFRYHLSASYDLLRGFAKYLTGSFLMSSLSIFQRILFSGLFAHFTRIGRPQGLSIKNKNIFGGKMGSAYSQGLSRWGQFGPLRVVKISFSPQSSACNGKGGRRA